MSSYIDCIPVGLFEEDDQDTLGMKNYILNNILDDDSDQCPTDDNSSGSRSSSPVNKAQMPEFKDAPKITADTTPIVGWTCASCENYNFKHRSSCNKCEKEKDESAIPVSKGERRRQICRGSKLNKVVIKGEKIVGVMNN